MDFWIAKLSNGASIEERWSPDELSPWTRLMHYCKKNNTYIEDLKLHMGQETYTLPPNAQGYWQAHGMPSVQGLDCDEELHKWRGIGAVHNGIVYIIWAARDPQTHQIIAWNEERSAEDQNQIIWGKQIINQILLPDMVDKNVKLYSDRIIGAS